ncbi:MAG: hypothetical protein P4L55_24120 [Syntrophobacteraceae bacterium]|nr:hypothetical protein [Syntrophobacteraceae bacterium]
MPGLPKFMRGGRVDYFGRKRIEKDVEIFIEDLNFWLDKVFLYQKTRTSREAERFMRQLSEGVNRELAGIMDDKVFPLEEAKRLRG